MSTTDPLTIATEQAISQVKPGNWFYTTYAAGPIWAILIEHKTTVDADTGEHLHVELRGVATDAAMAIVSQPPDYKVLVIETERGHECGLCCALGRSFAEMKSNPLERLAEMLPRN